MSGHPMSGHPMSVRSGSGRRWTSGLAALALATALLAGLSACRPSDVSVANGDDPLEALAVDAPTTRYAHDYWVDEARRGTAVWDSAYTYCSALWAPGQAEELAVHPNCGHVRTADFATAAGRRGVRRGRDMSVDSNSFVP